MRNFSFRFRTSLIISIASFALAVSLNAQLTGFTDNKAAPTPVQTVPAPAASVAGAPQPQGSQESGRSSATDREVMKKASHRAGSADRGERTEQSQESASEAETDSNYWNYALLLLAFVVIVLSVFVVLLYRRKTATTDGVEKEIADFLNSQRFSDRVDARVSMKLGAVYEKMRKLADLAKVDWADVDPDGAKQTKITTLKARIAALRAAMKTASDVHDFDAAIKAKAELDPIVLELEELDPPVNRRLVPSGGSAASVAILLCIGLLGAGSAKSATFCWNEKTGKTPGSTRAAIAVLGVSNTFDCSGSGNKIELVNETGAVIMTPSIIKKNPLTFEFTPAAVGRAIIRVDGRNLNQIAIRGKNEAELINDAVDLSTGNNRSSVSDSDAIFRAWMKAEFDFYCSAGCEGKSATQLFTLSTSSAKGSTAAAFTVLERARRNSTVNLALGDDRLKAMMTAGISGGINAYFQANPLPTQTSFTGGVSEQRVQEIASQTFDSKISPINGAIASVQAQADSTNISVGRVHSLATAHTEAIDKLFEGQTKGAKRLDPLLTHAWENKLACDELKANGRACPTLPQGKKK